MIVNEWIEPYTLMMGIHTMDVLIEALCVSGLVYAPFAVAITVSIVEALTQGEDEGNAGELAVKFLRKRMLMIMPVFILAFVPMTNSDVSFTMDIQNYSCDGAQKADAAPSSPPTQLLGNFSNAQKAVPIWWLLVHDMASTITNTTIASTPCADDLTMAQTNISSTALENVYDQQMAKDWQNSCLNSAVSQLSKAGTVEDDLWVGSDSLRNLYRNQESVVDIPIETAQKAGLTSATGATSNGATVKVNCDAVYQHIEDAAVQSARNSDSDSLSMMEQVMSALSDDAEKKIAMTLVAKVSMNSGAMMDATKGQMMSNEASANNAGLLSYTVATIGTILGNIFQAPTAVAQKMTAPILVCIFQMVLMAVAPILLVFSGFNIKTALSISGLYFGLEFTLVIINMATWVDNTLNIFFSSSISEMAAAGFSGAFAAINTGGPLSTSASSEYRPQLAQAVLTAVGYTGYDLLPKVWMGLLGYLGIKSGTQMLGKGMSAVEQATQQGAAAFMNMASNAKGQAKKAAKAKAVLDAAAAKSGASR